MCLGTLTFDWNWGGLASNLTWFVGCGDPMIVSAMVADVSEIGQFHMDPGTLGRFIRGALWAGFRHKELRV